ncbi:CSLREA domain-containing protein [Micromonospora rhizosphaerae]|uniref:CSLREA domain-containing protein n=1 Tax=Micromonospora rhizosphaerae TaxID=568872 RepID=A0A1C6S3S3_9ACTN|nr:right-handed parallel beta-helix repeat-containing protein [Micromonospora rhizosphaerae]SCL24151.1 CSLREA domain-containing protein [Micromonospora rhizosphaerae]
MAVQLLAAVVFAAPARAADVLTVTVTTADDDSTSCTPTSCTLRGAITAANASAGGAVITFNIAPSGPKTIAVGAGGNNPLPPITGSDVVLDASTQPGGGAVGVRLDDPDTGDRENGLVVQGQRVTVRGLSITRFGGFGIWLTSTSRDSVIAGNRIGTADGVTPLGITDDGMRVQGGGHRIGGTDPADRNLVAGGANDGIQITNSSDNVVVGNYVGMTADGLSRLPNSDSGIQITGASLRNRVGGTTAAERNVVSGNNGIGIQLLGTMRTDGTCASPEQNLVQGNYAGLDVNGRKPSPYGNQGAGIELGVCARNNTIGGSSAGAGNVASGNHDDGIQLDGRDGPGGTGAVCGNSIEGNIAGLDPTGSAARSNIDDGIDLDRGACNNTVTRNVVAGNSSDGIDLHERNANGAKTSGNQITANTVGLAADGLTSQPNQQHGVHIRFASTDNTVDGNTIAANGMSGVAIETSLAMRNVVRNNLIGLARDGSTQRGNRGHGVLVAGGTVGNTIATNIVAGNSLAGVAVDPQGAATATDGNRISRNEIRNNGRLGIDLLPVAGVNVNDGATSATVGNLGLDFPVIQAATETSVRGTAPAGSAVEVFLAQPGTGETNGEGAAFLASVTADDSGAWCVGGLSVTGGVTATATDDRGNTSEFSANVPPAGTDLLCAAPTVFVSDTFSRSVTNGWGSIDGFTWSGTGPSADYSVNGAAGVIQQSTTGARISTVPIGQQNVTVRTRFRFTAVPSSSWIGFYELGRVNGSGDWYGLRVRSVAGGTDDVEINRSTSAGGIVKVGAGAAVPEFSGGGWYWLQLEVRGDGTTTTVRGKVWRDGTTEPAGWAVTASDTTPSLQGQGGVGVRLLSNSAAGPAGVEVDDFTASAPG